ncbi:DUF4339 domain-containing protein [Prosthecobacter sp.]|uniref:DUF4339 domain-containing protein n=1 Tax=Prosthecobacter sp. TaxID=1965333 RepID=UPI0037851454
METTRTLWLSRDGESEPTGPFTEGQILTMWNAGQITANGMVAAEGDEEWVPVVQLTERRSVPPPVPQAPKRSSFSITRVLTGVVFFFGLLLVLTIFSVSGRKDPRLERVEQEQKREALSKAWSAGLLGEKIRQFEASPRVQELKREMEAEQARELAKHKQMPKAPPPALGQ